MGEAIRIIGIDPGLRRTGWGIIDSAGNSLRFVASGTVRSDDKAPLATRLCQLHDGLAEVLPEEVSLKYGYRADQRVVNLILRRRFNATSAEASADAPTAGGTSGQDATVTHFRIQNNTRTQLSVKASRATALLESERDLVSEPQEAIVVGAPAGVTEQPYRTLSPETASASINGVATRSFGNGVSATLLNRVKPPARVTSRIRAGPAWVPSARPTSWASDDGVQSSVENP